MLAFLNPDTVPPLLVAAVFAASLLQAVTGIGFGVIAGPALLVTMASAAAIQVSIVLSFLIALLLSPLTLPVVNWRLLRPLFIGVCLGTPIGALAFLGLSLETLKLFAAVVVGAMTLIATGMLSRHPIFETDSMRRRKGVGVVCGILNAALAMPGPPVAAYVTAIKGDKSVIRATTLVTFLFSYPIALMFQYAFVGISDEVLEMATTLSLPTIVGTLSGMYLSRIVGETAFKWLTVVFLSISVGALVVG
ncbi:sulfite exporter TauE/SafE family protein [Ruegeria sediminis]|uniref:Probable membrane transporter protein n=1 Tax=Ruegeria sediminis TaxID=2583820 RepID=A0ABY2WUM2_9RHOB|nr:sulfite exporter TauE/SafE family protein [Ruegeria sediminis]TMV05717.1 sulfite exporter TauE/SafE family protein [Ruegeria sediminis]